MAIAQSFHLLRTDWRLTLLIQWAQGSSPWRCTKCREIQKGFMAFVSINTWLPGFCRFCTVGVIHVRLCRALYLHCNQCLLHQVGRAKARLCLHFRVGIMSSSKRAVMEMVGSPAAGYSLRAGVSELGIEASTNFLPSSTGGLLDMGVGVHQHMRTGVSCSPPCRPVSAGDHQLIGLAGVCRKPWRHDAGNSKCASCHFRTA